MLFSISHFTWYIHWIDQVQFSAVQAYSHSIPVEKLLESLQCAIKKIVLQNTTSHTFGPRVNFIDTKFYALQNIAIRQKPKLVQRNYCKKVQNGKNSSVSQFFPFLSVFVGTFRWFHETFWAGPRYFWCHCKVTFQSIFQNQMCWVRCWCGRQHIDQIFHREIFDSLWRCGNRKMLSREDKVFDVIIVEYRGKWRTPQEYPTILHM